MWWPAMHHSRWLLRFKTTASSTIFIYVAAILFLFARKLESVWGKNSSIMHPSTELPLDDSDFRQHVSRHLPYIQLDTVYKYDEQNLRSRITELIVQEERAQAGNRLQHAMEKHDQLDARREKRHFILGRAHKTQILATSIVNFLDSFLNIGEIFKGIDARAGGILYGTLYVLLKVLWISQRRLQTFEPL
jgi:hypothetical protein